MRLTTRINNLIPKSSDSNFTYDTAKMHEYLKHRITKETMRVELT